MRVRSLVIALILSVLINGVLAVAYLHELQVAARPGTVAVELGGVGDAQIYLTQYRRDHNREQLGEAVMWLMWGSGILNEYSARTNDGPSSELSITVGNLAGALTKGEHVQTAIRLVRVLDTSIPVSGARFKLEQDSPAAFDETLQMLLKKMDVRGWNPLPY